MCSSFGKLTVNKSALCKKPFFEPAKRQRSERTRAPRVNRKGIMAVGRIMIPSRFLLDQKYIYVAIKKYSYLL